MHYSYKEYEKLTAKPQITPQMIFRQTYAHYKSKMIARHGQETAVKYLKRLSQATEYSLSDRLRFLQRLYKEFHNIALFYIQKEHEIRQAHLDGQNKKKVRLLLEVLDHGGDGLELIVMAPFLIEFQDDLNIATDL